MLCLVGLSAQPHAIQFRHAFYTIMGVFDLIGRLTSLSNISQVARDKHPRLQTRVACDTMEVVCHPYILPAPHAPVGTQAFSRANVVKMLMLVDREIPEQ